MANFYIRETKSLTSLGKRYNYIGGVSEIVNVSECGDSKIVAVDSAHDRSLEHVFFSCSLAMLRSVSPVSLVFFILGRLFLSA